MNASAQLYDNPLTRYKKDVWELCVSMNVFHDIDESYVEKTKEVFENIIMNYQTQILQQDQDPLLKQRIVGEVNQEVSKFKHITRDAIHEKNKNQFDLQLEEKQKEFNTMMHKDIPEKPQFQDNQEDAPLEQENLDALIQTQMKEREKVMNINPSIENKVVSSNSFTNEVTPVSAHPAPVQTPAQAPRQHFDVLKIESSIHILHQKVEKLQQNIKIQSTILTQIVESQLAILNKLK